MGTLRQAVNVGDARAVRAAIKAGGDARDPDLLKIAITQGNAKVLRLLLEAGANLAANESIVGDPVWFATLPHFDWDAWDPALLRLVLDHGADLGARTTLDETALLEVCDRLAFASDAAAGTAVGVITLLLDRGADLEARDHNGDTALLGLCAAPRHEAPAVALAVATTLIDRGAELDVRGTFRDREGWTPLMTAIEAGHDDLAQLLIERGADIGVTMPDGTSALLVAIEKGANEIGEALRARGAKVEPRDERLRVFLAHAAAERWSAVLAGAAAVAADFPDDPRVWFFRSRACARSNRWKEAEAHARHGLTLGFEAGMLQLLLYALNSDCRAPEAIVAFAAWKDRLAPDVPDADWALSHAIVAYLLAGRADDGWLELSPILRKLESNEASPWFNAACLAARVGELRDLVRFTRLAREHGLPREAFDHDSDFDPVRERPEFQAALALPPEGPWHLGVHFDTRSILLRDTELVIGGEPRTLDDRAYALVAWFERVRNEEAAGAKRLPDPGEAALAIPIGKTHAKAARRVKRPVGPKIAKPPAKRPPAASSRPAKGKAKTSARQAAKQPAKKPGRAGKPKAPRTSRARRRR